MSIIPYVREFLTLAEEGVPMDVQTLQRNPVYYTYTTVPYKGQDDLRRDTPLDTSKNAKENKELKGSIDCQTCRSRKYKDQSNDPAVSFQSAAAVSPAAAPTAVRSHDLEHVRHEQTKAKQEGSKVVFQNVSIQMDICPECGRAYVSGGTTTTVTKQEEEKPVGTFIDKKV